MKQFLKISAAPAAASFALAFVAMTSPAAARPVDYCRTDITSGMRGCGYSSLEQCQTMSSGRGGSCSENPFPSGGTTSSSGSSRNAYAFQPKHPVSNQPKHPVSKTARKPVENR
jgi:hypothetical protein